MFSLLDEPQLRGRVPEISIDLESLEPEDGGLRMQILVRADAIRRRGAS